MPSIEDRLAAIRCRILSSATAAGRDPQSVRLVAVSKTHPPEAVREALSCGQTLFGENKIQEAQGKVSLLPAALEWHFIGHLQSNKIRRALPLFQLFHGIDSADTAMQINRIASESGLRPALLLEVNTSGETSKFGFSPDVLRQSIDRLLALPHIEVRGLMTMAPYCAESRESAPYFATLRELRDEIVVRTAHPLPELSMGMSGDFETAILEGSTLVRIGSAIFGERPVRR